MSDNPNHDWLTYETVFNQVRFQRPNGQYQTHLYCLPRNEVIVWFRDGIDDATVKALSAAFFPDEADALAHRNVSEGAWPWKRKGERTMPPATPQEVPLRAGPGCVLHAPARVVLPYNEFDNHEGSLALGTTQALLPLAGRGQEAPDPVRVSPLPGLLDPELKWDMWRTASRSCVMRLEPLIAAWPRRRRPPEDPNWHFGWRRNEAGGGWERFWDTGPSGAAHRLSPDHVRQDFSVKTGVSHVGGEYQQDKQRIDVNWIVACLRSDYLQHMQKEAPAPENDLVFVTELLTIAEREERPEEYGDADAKHPVAGWRHWQRDGVQVRDLAPLLEGARAGKMYIPPLSIPFVGWSEDLGTIDFATRTDEFRDIRNDNWSTFWREAWATLLGRAKALLLVRYALQSINPHTQNFLLEFEPEGAGWASTKRLIVRDVQDTAISREVAWALHRSKDGKLPPTTSDDLEKLDKHPLSGAFTLEVLEYEFGPAREGAQETGTKVGEHYEYKGTHLLWRLFSQFGKDKMMADVGARIYKEGNAATVAGFPAPPPPVPAAAAVLPVADPKKTFINQFTWWLKFRMAEWGLAHNRAYLHALEEALGHNFCVDWKTLADPQRPTGSEAEGQAAPPVGGAAAWEDQASALVDEHLGTLEGQRQIRAYRDRKWERAAPKVTLCVKSGGKASPYRKIALQRREPDKPEKPKEWVDLTDEEGMVFLYQGTAADYRYRFDLERGDWLSLLPSASQTYDLVVPVAAPRPPAPAPPPPRAPAPASASSSTAASKPAAAPASKPAPAPKRPDLK